MIKTIILGSIWAVAIWRLPAAIRVPKQRVLWVCFAALAVAITLGIPSVGHALDRAVAILNVSILLKHLVTVIDCGAALEFVVSMARPEAARKIRGPHIAVAALAMISLITLFTLIPMSTEVDDFYEAYAGSSAATAYSAVVIGYLGLVMAIGTWLFWSYSRHTGAAWLRAGLRCLATGTAVGMTYAVLRVVQMVTALIGASQPVPSDMISNIEWLAIALILVGNTIPAVGVAVRARQAIRAMRAIRPLWTSLTAHVPDIVLEAQRDQGPRLRLHRMVIEIRDATLALVPFADEKAREDAARTAEAQGLSDEQVEYMTEALILRAAAVAKAAGREPSPGRALGDTSAPEGLDFDAEIRRLQGLNDAYHSPIATAFPSENP
ncbi:MAB_1171c family putative transporter [Streptomyces sp. NPDC002550]